MALTRKEYTGNGSTTLYNVDFDLGYIDKDYVYVYLVDKSIEDQLSYTWRNDNQIELSTPVASGVKFYIRRVIPRDELVNDYEDGAILREGNLNDSYLQTLMILEEVQDGFITVDDEFLILAKIVISQNLDMQGFRITNAADAVDNTDLATVNDVLKYAAISKGASFVQEEQPTAGMVQGSEWYIPSKCETYVYFIQPDGNAYWVNEDSVGDDLSYETISNGEGGNLRTDLEEVNTYIDGQQFASVDAVKVYSKLSKLIGQRITTGEYHTGTGIGGASYDVVSSGSVTPNDIDIIQGVADSGAAIVLIGENDERAESYGVYADNSNDSTDSLQRAITQSTLGELKKPVEIYGRPIIDGLTIPAGGALNSRGGQLQGRVETSTGITCEGGFTTIDGVIVDTNATSSSNYAVTFDGDPSSFGHVFKNGRVIGENGVLIDCFEGKIYNSYFRGLGTGTAVNVTQYDASVSELLIQDYNIGAATNRGLQANDLHVVRCNTGILLREEGHPNQLVNTYLDTPFEYGARLLDQSNVTFTATYVLNVGGDAGDGKNNGSFASGFYIDGNSQGCNFFGVHFIQTDSSKWANSFNFLLGSKNHNVWAVSGAYKMSATNKQRMRQQTVLGCKGQHARHNNIPRKCRDIATGVAVGSSVDLVFYLDYVYPDDDFNTLLFKGDFTSRNGASKGAFGNIYIPIQYNDTGCSSVVNVISGDVSIDWTVTNADLSGDILTVTVQNTGTQTSNIAVQLERGLDAKGETF